MVNWLREKVTRAAIALAGGTRYLAAAVNRLTGDWSVNPQSADSEIRANLRQLRARSRELGKNNDYIKAFFRMCETNIVGSAGFDLRPRLYKGDKLDKNNNDAIKEAFKEWSKKKYASIDTISSFHSLLCLIARTLPQDGEVFIRKIVAPNKFGFAMQLIDADWFDERYNEQELANGNRVVMSIEKDKWGRPVAYYATNPNTDPYDTIGMGDRVRIPAKEIIHLFVPIRPGQTRGVPWAHTAMVKLNHLYGFEEATVVGARVGASQMGVVTKPVAEGGYPGPGATPPTIPGEVQPGSLLTLPDGYDFKQFDPKQPTVSYGEFVKAMLRGVASGLGVSYNNLANDLENVNYSSMRAGTLEEREVWKKLHRFFIEHLLEEVYESWLISSLVFGALSLPGTVVEKAKTAVHWRARGWAWVDPLKDMQANELALGMGVTTLTRIAAENGEDIEEILYERKQELELIKSLELELNDGTKPSKPDAQDGSETAQKGNKPKSGNANGN